MDIQTQITAVTVYPAARWWRAFGRAPKKKQTSRFDYGVESLRDTTVVGLAD